MTAVIRALPRYNVLGRLRSQLERTDRQTGPQIEPDDCDDYMNR